jgi:hypothetical protein
LRAMVAGMSMAASVSRKMFFAVSFKFVIGEYETTDAGG